MLFHRYIASNPDTAMSLTVQCLWINCKLAHLDLSYLCRYDHMHFWWTWIQYCATSIMCSLGHNRYCASILSAGVQSSLPCEIRYSMWVNTINIFCNVELNISDSRIIPLRPRRKLHSVIQSVFAKNDWTPAWSSNMLCISICYVTRHDIISNDVAQYWVMWSYLQRCCTTDQDVQDTCFSQAL